MVFSSYVVGLFGLFILEFSLWNNFGNYIWYVSIGFTILDMVIGDIVSYQLKEVSECFWRKCRETRAYSEQTFPPGWSKTKGNGPSLMCTNIIAAAEQADCHHHFQILLLVC